MNLECRCYLNLKGKLIICVVTGCRVPALGWTSSTKHFSHSVLTKSRQFKSDINRLCLKKKKWSNIFKHWTLTPRLLVLFMKWALVETLRYVIVWENLNFLSLVFLKNVEDAVKLLFHRYFSLNSVWWHKFILAISSKVSEFYWKLNNQSKTWKCFTANVVIS